MHALEDRRDICKVHSCTGSLIILIKKSIKSLKNNHFLEYAREWHSSRNDHGVDDPNPCGNLHRPRNQRLPSGRTLIPELIDACALHVSFGTRGRRYDSSTPTSFLEMPITTGPCIGNAPECEQSAASEHFCTDWRFPLGFASKPSLSDFSRVPPSIILVRSTAGV